MQAGEEQELEMIRDCPGERKKEFTGEGNQQKKQTRWK